MEGKMTVIGRTKLCKAHAGEGTLPKIAYMVFGSGGTDQADQPIPVTGEETALYAELMRKPISSKEFVLPTTCRYFAHLDKPDLAGQFISEQGLIDEEGDLIIFNTFLKKGKDANAEMTFAMDEIF